MFRTLLSLVCCFYALAATAADGDTNVPAPRFYLPFENQSTPLLAAGNGSPLLSAPDPILALVAASGNSTEGKVAKAGLFETGGLSYSATVNFRRDEGTCALWINPNFAGKDTGLYCIFMAVDDWGMVYKYTDQASLTFATYKPSGDLFYDCGASIADWQPGQWHHVAFLWSRSANQRRLYIDGKLLRQAPFPFHRERDTGTLSIGCGPSFGTHLAHSRIDEFAIWDTALSETAVVTVYSRGCKGEPLVRGDASAAQAVDAQHITVVSPQSPPAPKDAAAPASQSTPTRQQLLLDGWWSFALLESAAKLGPQGWGWARVPGYFLPATGLIGPDGQPVKNAWQNISLSTSQALLGVYQRLVAVPEDWRGRHIVLHCGGLEGCAQIYLNGQRLSTLISWEDATYTISDLVRYGAENTLTLAIAPLANSAAGIYGQIKFEALPRAFLHDVTLAPHPGAAQLAFSCAVGGIQPGSYTLDFESSSGQETATVKRGSHAFTFAPKASPERDLYCSLLRVEGVLDWPQPHCWTFDDPHTYLLHVRLREGQTVVDALPEVRFGFREFAAKAGTFYLNGSPVHLRGHQLPVYGKPLESAAEFKNAGMNCFELLGPISHEWVAARRAFNYNLPAFESILDYADRNGLIAIPCMPSAATLRETIFDNQVAAHYRRRLDKYVRRFGNHPSLCMWFMDFNLTCNAWNMAPSKVDGSYKRTDPGFQRTERYAMEAHRIAAELDPRPIFHHSCGNFGGMITTNNYIGPETPLQEREEWPSRWAEKKALPLIACEHCLFLIPYWYRLRKFPLSEVYSSEPLFEEFSARFLGPRAYGLLTPDIFDVYQDKDWSRRLRSLTAMHPGYQQVKCLVGRHSLRGWRTCGISGTIYNAELWDFRDRNGAPNPTLRASQRYFNHTDFYIAGPPGDFPCKDHSFFTGEKVRKQAVLLCDLTHEVPDVLRWELKSDDGRIAAHGDFRTAFRPGEPVFLPLEFDAPGVDRRTEFILTLHSEEYPDRDDSFSLQVFPRRGNSAVSVPVLLHDPAGATATVLAKAAIETAALTKDSAVDKAGLLIVGRDAYAAQFQALAQEMNLEAAVKRGLNLLVFEQREGELFGLKPIERSERMVFAAVPEHPFLAGLSEPDFCNFRGSSDRMEAYPEPDPLSEKQWPSRFFKWGNRGIVATHVLTRPHYMPFMPVLECGFDLVESPLLEARFGKGRVVLCQLDVTSRFGTDPVSTRLVGNLLSVLSKRGTEDLLPCECIGTSAEAFLQPFAVRPAAGAGARRLIVAGHERDSLDAKERVETAVRKGATALLLPGSPLAAAFGLELGEERFFMGKLTNDALLSGLNNGDLFVKEWVKLPAALPKNGWQVLAAPGLVAEKRLGEGWLVSCQLDPLALPARGRIKAVRFWNVLLANLGVERSGQPAFMRPAKALEENEFEKMPRYFEW